MTAIVPQCWQSFAIAVSSSRVNTLPVGLFGVLMMIARVLFENAALELFRVVPPITLARRRIRLAQLHEARCRARQNRIGSVVLVVRLEDDHLIARIDDGHHRGHERFGRAAAHGDLLVGDDRHAV